MPNLKVDRLLKVALRILANYTSTLLQLHLKDDVYTYMRAREKRLLETIMDQLLLPKRETLQSDTMYNVPLLGALLLYVGVHLPQHGKTPPGQGSNLQLNNPWLEIFLAATTFQSWVRMAFFLRLLSTGWTFCST